MSFYNAPAHHKYSPDHDTNGDDSLRVIAISVTNNYIS